jgi:hypothetical protein
MQRGCRGASNMFGCQGRFAARWEEVIYDEVLLEEGGVVVPCHETYIDLLVAGVATIERKTCKPMSTGRLPPLVFDHVRQQSHRNELCLLNSLRSQSFWSLGSLHPNSLQHLALRKLRLFDESETLSNFNHWLGGISTPNATRKSDSEAPVRGTLENCLGFCLLTRQYPHREWFR